VRTKVKKTDKSKMQKRARKLLIKRTEKKQKNKTKRLRRLHKNISTKRADRETYKLEDEVRRIQAQGARDSARMSAEAAEKAVEITEEEYNKAKETLEDLGVQQEETKA
jgi:hypothetical protein